MLYHKIIKGSDIISQCKTLITEAGEKISNPTQEQIFAEGWEIYTPPPFIPSPQDEPDYGQVVEAVKRMFSTDTQEMTDEEALEVAALYPTWHSLLGKEVAAGARLWDDGRLWKVLQPHTVQDDWRPDVAVSLYVEVSIEEWPEWRQPVGAHDAYNAGDRVSHNDRHWESTTDGNIWEPGVFGWKEV